MKRVCLLEVEEGQILLVYANICMETYNNILTRVRCLYFKNTTISLIQILILLHQYNGDSLDNAI